MLHGKEEKPSCLNIRKHPQFVDILKDRLTAVYVGKGIHTDFGAVQSNNPVPSKVAFYYFEVRIVKAVKVTGAKICVGLTCKNSLLNRAVGSDENAVGYQGTDGWKLVANSRRGSEPFGPIYGENDIIGCGIDYINSDIFFTKNGLYLGAATQTCSDDYYPSAGMHLLGDRVEFNFSGPFKFDFNDYMRQRALKYRISFENQIFNKSTIVDLIRLYLLHRGHVETLIAFDSAIGRKNALKGEGIEKFSNGLKLIADSSNYEETFGAWKDRKVSKEEEEEEKKKSGVASMISNFCSSTLRRISSDAENNRDAYFQEIYTNKRVEECLEKELWPRKALKQAIMNGNILLAIKLVELHYPNLLKAYPPTLAAGLLLSQQIVELLRGENPNYEAAVDWMRSKLAALRDASPCVEAAISECCALICYDSPMTSPLAHCFDKSRRSLAANKINDYILKYEFNISPMSPLNILISHIVCCRQEIKNEDENKGFVPTSRFLCQRISNQVDIIVRECN